MTRRHLVAAVCGRDLTFVPARAGPAGRFQPAHARPGSTARRVRQPAVRARPLVRRRRRLHHARADRRGEGRTSSGTTWRPVNGRSWSPAGQLSPEGGDGPLEVEDYAWSPDGRCCWSSPTRSRSGATTPGATTGCSTSDRQAPPARRRDAKPSTLMFAKFSPDGDASPTCARTTSTSKTSPTAAITPLTTDGSRTMINGTFDWVYEEELMTTTRRLALESRRQADRLLAAQRGQREELQPDQQHRLALFPGDRGAVSKAGEANSAARIGVVPAAGGATRWLDIAGDPRNHYIPRMDWAAGSDEVIVQRLNRLQNTHEVMLGDARTGAVRTVLTENDSHLGRCGRRPGLAQGRAASSPGSASATAGSTCTPCPVTARPYG